MARPLTKVTKSGELYTRLATVEAAIDAALGLDRITLEQRAAVADRNSPEYISSECLVHLIRKKHRETNAPARDQLLNILLQRCAASLARTLPDDRTPNAAFVRDEVLARLGELLAEDGTGDNPDELDFFEVRFNRAFAALRTDLVRAEIRAARSFVPLPDEENDEQLAAEDQAMSGLSGAALKNPATQENSQFLRELFKAIAKLPPDQRDAVILCHVMGYEAESEDPAKITAATLRGVTGRTIRNRLRRAAASLKQYKKEGL
jgi:DNA-directed RNA polymerase specialized sigma24 family protein